MGEIMDDSPRLTRGCSLLAFNETGVFRAMMWRATVCSYIYCPRQRLGHVGIRTGGGGWYTYGGCGGRRQEMMR